MQRSRAQKEYVEHNLVILKNYVMNGNVVFYTVPLNIHMKCISLNQVLKIKRKYMIEMVFIPVSYLLLSVFFLWIYGNIRLDFF